MMNRIATVLIDGETITGKVYSVRENGWPCVETSSGRVASGPEVDPTDTLHYTRGIGSGATHVRIIS